MTAAAQFPGPNAPGGAPQGQRMSGQQVLSMVGGLIDRGRFREAAGQTQQLIKQAPDALPVLILHGSAMRRVGRMVAARTTLEKALAILDGDEKREAVNRVARGAARMLASVPLL